MKRMILFVVVLFSLIGVVEAQTTKKKSTAKKQVSSNKNTAKKSTKQNNNTATVARNSRMTYTLNSISTNNAYAANNSSNARLEIADPTVRALNARANGANVAIGKSGIVGMPKRAYGIANGHIIFRSTDATSSGSTTGSGAVGTGTSPAGMGAMGRAIGVNGKNPYAGTGMWGTNATLIGAKGIDAAARTTSNVKD